MAHGSVPGSPPHPWCLVPAADYEGHMGTEGVDQLRPLSAVLRGALEELRPESLLVLGVATGNGLEQIDVAVTQRVVGIDVNPEYLALARQRHAGRLGSRLELRCVDVERDDVAVEGGAFEMVWAGLIFEHVDFRRVVPRIAGWLAPGGWLVAALQLSPAASGPVAPSRFTSLQVLAPSMRLVPPTELGALLSGEGLTPGAAEEVPMAQGRRLHVSRWRKPGRT